MHPDDAAPLEAAAWQGFVQRLGEHLAAQWPAMPERLGDRYATFIDMAVQQAQAAGLNRAASVARFVNLWFVWGPAFQDKPGFEWAQALLASARSHEWLAVHQLVQRSLAELQRLPGSRIEPQALLAADRRVLDSFGQLGRQGRLHPAEPLPAPRAACDLEAADIRLLDADGQQVYRLGTGASAGQWHRTAQPVPAALRVDAGHAMPKLVAVLSHPADQGLPARLQVRLRALTVCDGDVHPVLGFSGPHGRWVWTGHEAKAASWPLLARDQPQPKAGPGSAIAEETSPELQRLEIEFCGLSDDGDVIGSQQALVSVWPAAQWWLELHRSMPAAQAVLPGPRAWARNPTRCRIERDGVAQDAMPLRQQFEQGLDSAVAVGVQTLAAAWERLPGLASARLEAQLGLLTGQASLTWGWQLGAGGLAGPALMRVVGLFELIACQADLQLAGELTLSGSRTRITLRLAGQAALRQTLQRESPLPPLAELLMGAVARWRFPVELALEPLAVESGSLLQQAGPITGALVGEAGLRPCTTGTSGWEWFVGLRVEPVSVPLMVTDPLLGQRRFTQSLLPDLALVHWSLG